MYAQLTLKEDNYANILLASFPLVNSTLVENENPVFTRNLFEGKAWVKKVDKSKIWLLIKNLQFWSNLAEILGT